MNESSISWPDFTDDPNAPRVSNRNPLRISGPTWYISPWWRRDAITSVQQSVLRLIAFAVREKRPIAPLVHALALEHRGATRTKLLRFVARIDSGLPWIDALEQTPGVLDEYSVLALRCGSQLGTLQSTTQQLMQSDSRPDSFDREWRDMVGYWIVLASTIVLFIVFMGYVVTPTFKRIAEEDWVVLPESLRMLMSFTNGAVQFSVLIVCLAVVLTVLCLSRTVRHKVHQAFAPIVSRFGASTRSVPLFRILAIGLQHGRTVASVLSTLARYHYDPRSRARLLFARNEIEQGVAPWDSLASAQLLTPAEMIALKSAPNSAIQSWTLQALASTKLQQHRSSIRLAFAFLTPMVVILLGLLVLWVTVAHFGFLTDLIEHNAQPKWGN